MAKIATWICWSAVIVAWIAGALFEARGSHRRRQGPSGALWGAVAVIGAVLVFRLALHDLRRLTAHSWWIELSGFVLLVASTAFTLWARARLGRMWSASPNMLQEDHELRTDGPYAITRHPIYSGLLGMLLGTVLLNGLGLSLGFLAVGAVFLATRIPIEERLMSTAFPDEYASYRKRVPLLIPGLHLLRRSHCPADAERPGRDSGCD
jgi:protein-S-isoprenylcysteine O-methyltransferase Ste14